MTGWRTRTTPLDPAGACATGPAARTLARAAVDRIAGGALLRAAVGADVLVLVGDDLPWVDGVAYLGWDGGALVPTTLEPTTHPDLLRRAAAGPDPSRLVVLQPGATLVCARPEAGADPQWLLRWAERG